MKKTTLIYVVLIVSMLYSCNKPKTQDTEPEVEDKEIPADKRAEKALYDEVFAIHDEIMPRMDELVKLRGKVQEKLDLLREDDNPDEATIKEMTETITLLENADEGMMSWMRGFEPQDDVADHDSIMTYYEDQKAKIMKVKEDMLGALENAKKILEKN